MSDIVKRMQLPDGRWLGYTEHGDPQGQPVFFFHGTPGSRKDWDLFGNDAIVSKLGMRLIAIDRPGMGFSDFQPGRRFLDWPQDVACLASSLGFQQFSVLGYSSGGAYALACALLIPGRLSRVGVVSGDGPYTIPGPAEKIDSATLMFLNLSRRSPGLFRTIQWAIGWSARYLPGLFLAAFRAFLPDIDRVVAGQPQVREALCSTVRESLRQGPRGAQQDTALMVGPWDFQPQDIGMPVHLWYGEADQSTPPAMGHYLAEVIPDNLPHFYPGEGHLSLIAHHTEEILGELKFPASPVT